MSTFEPHRHPRRPNGKFASAPPPASPDPDLAADLADSPTARAAFGRWIHQLTAGCR